MGTAPHASSADTTLGILGTPGAHNGTLHPQVAPGASGATRDVLELAWEWDIEHAEPQGDAWVSLLSLLCSPSRKMQFLCANNPLP